MNDALPQGRTRTGKYGEAMIREMNKKAVLAGAPQEVLVGPNV